MEGDTVGDGAEDGSWRKAGEVVQIIGDPRWSRDTPKELQHLKDLGWEEKTSKKEGAEKENNKK